MPNKLLENTQYILADAEQILEQAIEQQSQDLEDEIGAMRLLLALKKYRKCV